MAQTQANPSSKDRSKLALGAVATAGGLSIAYGLYRYITTPDDPWRVTLNRLLPAIVVIRVNFVRAWDNDDASASTATGFIVDKKRGIILTNRHVVGTGPISADAVMKNKEEITLKPIYRDPVHDFAFFQYDTEDLKHMEAEEILLAPHEAVVGTEIRVVGNDAGEKLSILGGTLARLDRNAPSYGKDTYNDINTFYYAAASNTSGGSSGSPVLNVNGNAVALNAGGAYEAASSFYLPLDRVVRALALLQKHLDSPIALTSPPSASISRGELRVVFKHQSFGEVERFGLRPSTLAEVRKAMPDDLGLLVVDQVVPGGHAAELVEAGDVLLRVNGHWCLDFVLLERELDDAHEQKTTVKLEIERGGVPMTLEIPVEDAHAVCCPSSFLEVSACIIHPLSFTQARNYNVEPGTPYIATSGFMLNNGGVGSHSIIVAIGDTETKTVKDVEAAMCRIPDGEKTMIRFMTLGSHQIVKVAVFRMDRSWNTMRMYTRRDEVGKWTSRKCAPPPAEEAKAPQALPPVTSSLDDGLQKVISSLVTINFQVAYGLDGVHSFMFLGTGVVVDSTRGIVATDRNTVAITAGDVTLTFGSSVEVRAEVMFLHPIHNFALVRYDPGHLSAKAPEAVFSPKPLVGGSKTTFVGLTETGEMSLECVVKERRIFNYSRLSSVPRFIAHQEDILRFDQQLGDVLGGVFTDEQGQVQALLHSYSYVKSDGTAGQSMEGFPVESLVAVVEPFKKGGTPQLHVLGVELRATSVAKARTGMGLSNEWVERLHAQWEEDSKSETDINSGRKQVLTVHHTIPNTPAAEELQEGDIILEVNGVPRTTFWGVEQAVLEHKEVELSLLRQGKEMKCRVKTSLLDGSGTDRAVTWCGMVLQRTYREVAARGFLPPQGGVYYSYYLYGSPAHKHGIFPKQWITEVNGTETPDLDTFMSVVRHFADGAKVRVKTVTLEGQSSMHTLKTDAYYWPTTSVRRKGSKWDTDLDSASE